MKAFFREEGVSKQVQKRNSRRIATAAVWKISA